MLKDKTILLGVSGSIAAYKSASLASKLVQAGADVHVLMTQNATNFINPITFETLTGKKCLIDTFDRNFNYSVEHVALAKKADVFVLAPATANVIAKIAHGLADDMLTTTFLACRCPKLISPAMNTAMFENAITQENLNICQKFDMTIIEPASGYLACGDTGSGKMPEPETLFDWIEYTIGYKKDLVGKNVLITAGPTQEPLDPVRYLTNHSTGKMGYAIAKVSAARGATVTLISGQTNLATPLGVKRINVVTAKDMFDEVAKAYKNQDIVIKAAAVADYRPIGYSDEKLKKKDNDLHIDLERTDDILAWLGEHKILNQFLCGFSMETQDMLENSRAKLKKKNLDMIVANNLKTEGAGFGTDTNVVTLITDTAEKPLPLQSKESVANALLDAIIASIPSKTR
ncbi:MAG: bifunctional phosphopantothenoylcysteine decarboxylase/phosphopantothenate--cysteine ligase CoaBC [Treponema sp.]|nr:bifunctional phosphopantothenoylcysteine decarboxylase/phosphopantothenate--cysteine ligase CoaBC [Treponema sp.]